MADETGNEVAHRADAAAAFVELVDALVGDFDVIDMLTVLATRCVELLGIAAAGILLADPDETLRVIGASNEQAHLLELLQVQNEEGPCLDCYLTGNVVIATDLTLTSPWPSFAAASVASGYQAVCALPLRLKDFRIGCLNLFMIDAGELAETDVALARALADVASIAIVQDQSTRDAAVREVQLQHALESRIVIEQAKGMIVGHAGVSMDGAFSRLRTYARSHNERLTDVAASIVGGSLAVRALTPQPLPPSASK